MSLQPKLHPGSIFLPEEFGKYFSSLPRVLDHCLEQNKADATASPTLPVAHHLYFAAEEPRMYRMVASACFCYVSFPAATS